MARSLTKKNAQTRVAFFVSDTLADKIDKCADAMSTTRTGVLTVAASLVSVIRNRVKNGGKLYFEDENGQKAEIVVPGLTDHADTEGKAHD